MIFPRDLKVIKEHLILGNKRWLEKKSVIECIDYIYHLTPKKVEHSFMSSAENKGELQFCMVIVANEIT